METMAQVKRFLPGDGEKFVLGRMTLTFKTTADDNSGAYTLCEAIEPPGSGAALHRHPTYDETFIICEGNYEFQVGEESLALAAGDMVFVPRGTPHSFKSIGPETGRQLNISSPGGIFDAFIAEVTASMIDSGSPSRPGPAMEFRTIAAKYGMEFLS
ncbi:MAG: cupin domain-containing protein [Rhodanobacteraceae bacterium]